MSSVQAGVAKTGESPVVFDPESIGRSFRELGVDVIEGESTVFTSRWFHSREDADLFIWVDGEKRVIKHQLCLFGQVIEWNPIDGTRTGVIIETETAPTPQGKLEAGADEASEMIRFDAKAQCAAVQQAMAVLSFVPDLNEADKSLLIHNLRESPKLHPKARERALKAWAPKAAEISSDQRPTFWRRLKSWVLG